MASGTIAGSTSNRYIKVRVTWSSTPDEANNRSTVTATLQARKLSDSSESTVGTGTWYLVIDGQSQTFTKRLTLEPNDTWVTIGTSTKTVNHTEDGTKTITITASGKITSASTSWSSTTLSGTGALESIPRQTKPTFNATTREFGQNLVITLNRADSTFYHTVSYVWNNTTTVIANNVGTSLTFTIPMNLISTIPNAASGTMSFVVTTYRANGSVVGTATGSITVTVPASCAPVINSVTVSDTGNTVPSEWGIYVSGKSILHVNVSASGQYGATIKSYSISALGQTKTGNNIDIGTIQQSGTVTVSVTVTDSRGKSTTNSSAASITVYDYSAPSISAFNAVRCNEHGNPVDNGAYARVSIDCSISPLNGHNEMEITIFAKRSDESTFTEKRVISPESTSHSGIYVITGIDPAYTYTVKAEIVDAFSTSWQDGEVAAEGAIISWRDGGLGIAFGKMAEEDYTAEFGWRIHAREGITLDEPLGTPYGGTGNANGTIGIDKITYDANTAAAFFNNVKSYFLNLVYPVGSIYISINSTSPATLFGGTWAAYAPGRVLLGAGAGTDTNGRSITFSAGGQNGEYYHTLSVSEMPSHSHTMKGYGNGLQSGSNRYRWGQNGTETDDPGPINSTGGGVAHNNMQPYVVVYMWRRTA